jgi:hypothetical protein
MASTGMDTSKGLVAALMYIMATMFADIEHREIQEGGEEMMDQRAIFKDLKSRLETWTVSDELHVRFN